MFFGHQTASAGILAWLSPREGSVIIKKTTTKEDKTKSECVCLDASPQRRCKWAGRAIPASAPSACPVSDQKIDFEHGRLGASVFILLSLFYIKKKENTQPMFYEASLKY